MNKVLLTGRLTRDPELRVLASGKNVTTSTCSTPRFTVSSTLGAASSRIGTCWMVSREWGALGAEDRSNQDRRHVHGEPRLRVGRSALPGAGTRTARPGTARLMAAKPLLLSSRHSDARPTAATNR
jgi:hypothetical protein